jgi:hypothetical protein
MSEEQKQKNPVGRPTSYKPEYAKKAYKLALLGINDKKLADFFEVSEQTINSWKKEFPEFLESLKNGKEEADANVAARFYNKAIGYVTKEEKAFCLSDGTIVTKEITKRYPPDTAAAFIWLKNRNPNLWRDKQEIKHTGGVTFVVDKEDEDIL